MQPSELTSEYPELGCYLLPGHTESPADALHQVRSAEALGLGSAWISERLDVKEFAAIGGATLGVTDRIYVGSAATNANVRHPLVTASMASTLHRLSNGRFAFGLARGIVIRDKMMGNQPMYAKHLDEFVPMMRKLWAGETVSGETLFGNMPLLRTAKWMNDEIPLGFVGFGERSVAHAATLFDGVILHTFIGHEALERLAATSAKAAEEAGRDPADFKIWSVLATLIDPDEERYLKGIVARMATYLQAPVYGDLLVGLNGWDPAILERFRKSDVVSGMRASIDSSATYDELREIRELIPEEWYPAAVGTADECAQVIADEFDHGAYGVVIHASEPDEFAPAVEAYGKIRDHARFEGRTNRPF